MSAETWTTYPAQAHALPFRTIFGEYRARRPGDLAAAVEKHLPHESSDDNNPKVAWAALDVAMTESEHSYRILSTLKESLQSHRRRRDESTEDFKARIAEAYERTLLAEQVCEVKDRALKSILHAMEGTAVCLSGGGIRSASFSLGVLEGLSRFSRRVPCQEKQTPLMDALDYLSTVSGGGYIGSWMMAWSARSSYHQVISQLSAAAPTAGDPEPRPVRHLREYTSYLTPKYGFTLDTLTLFSIVLRNMILNWFMIVPVMIALLCIPEFLYEITYGWPFAHQRAGENWFYGIMAGAVLSVLIASAFAVWRMARPPYVVEEKGHQQQGRAVLELLLFAAPLFIGAWLIGEASAWVYISTALNLTQWSLLTLTKWLFLFTIVPPLAMALVRVRLLWHSDGKARPTPFHKHDGSGRIAWRRLAWSFIAPVIVAAFAALLLAGCARFVGQYLVEANQYHVVIGRRFMICAVPLVLGVLMLSSTVLSGLLTNIEQEEEREWWARAGGLLFSCLLCYVGLNAIAFYGADTLHLLTGSILVAVGLGAGYLGSTAGLSAATASGLKRIKPEELTSMQRFLAKHDLIAPVASGIALICLMLALATLTGWLRIKVYDHLLEAVLSPYTNNLQGLLSRYLGIGIHTRCTPCDFFTWVDTVDRMKLDSLATLLVFGSACLLAVFSNLFININTFSLHGMYRMRLTRAYLGASNFARRPDAFTNFDHSDNLYQADIPCQEAPLHVVNTALNVVATRNMAWQQRKAEPFTFTPLSAGSWRLGYVPAEDFGGSRGVRLGTAMAISGAAFNPNMGYSSSPLVTLLMTFFNARLGWWLPNPVWPVLRKISNEHAQKKYLGRNGPKWALMPLINEALGNTDDTYKWVELTDGGHFENLGLYEMVLRRCRRIIVVDADSDCDFQFEDLGNAIRKIAIDLGIPITFPGYAEGVPFHRGVNPANVYCVRGQIEYDCVDACASRGELLYIKPSMNGSEPPDIRAYAAAHPTFPHESTANQFFNESQFESYRHLGSWIITSLYKDKPAVVPGCGMEAFFARVTPGQEKAPATSGEIPDGA